MLPIQPFIFNAYYSWITDSGMTPHIHINCVKHDVSIPQSAIADDGTAILNISMASANNFTVTGAMLSFNASFSGRREIVVVPMEAIIAIYSRENPSMGTVLYDNMDDPEEIVDPGEVVVEAPTTITQPAPQHPTYRKLRAVNGSDGDIATRTTHKKPKLSLIH